MHEQDKQLIDQCNLLKNVVSDGMDWVNSHAESDKKAVTIYNLKKFRRFTNRYLNAIPKRPSIAIFGQSQVGKSYLVSNLTKTPEQFSLEVLVPGQDKRVDFIEAINPPGGGKEATGLVSRFTTYVDHQSGQQPYVLKLFSQADVAKVISNGFLSDITHYKFTIDRDAIQSKLAALATKRSATPMPGFSEDDVYDLKEYLNHKFRDHFIVKDLNNIDFWEDLASTVPFLDAETRWEILETLWGEQSFFTELFQQLSSGLKQIKFNTRVRVELEALTPQADTILDVERLRELYRDNKKPAVNVYDDSAFLSSLDRSIISALTAEVVLPVPMETANNELRSFLKDADVLDFPGARSRQQIPEDTFGEKPNDDKLLVFLRGKVAFLFDRYNMNYEISTLMFCMDNKQPEVADLPQFLYEWIKNTHGGNAQEREKRENILSQLVPNRNIDRLIPLLVVFTKFNIELAGNPATEKPGDLGPHNSKWTARVGANFADQMGISISDKWIEQWDTKSPFKNLFMLRDPKWSKSVYDGMDSGNKETGIKLEYQQKMVDMEKSFTNHPDILRHFHYPQEAWKEATDINKSGMDYIVKYMAPTCNPVIKREQIKAQILAIQNELYNELAAFYQGGDIKEKLAKARINAAQVFMGLMKMQKEKNTFGNFIDQLVISDDISWKIYFDLMMKEQIDQPEQGMPQSTSQEKTIPLDMLDMLRQFIEIEDGEDADSILRKLRDFFGIADNDSLTTVMEESGIDIKALVEAQNNDEPTETRFDRANIFAANLLSKWLEHIERIKEDQVLHNLGINKKIADLVIRELDKNKNRINLKRHIADQTREHILNFQLTSNVDIVARISATMLNDFVNTLGWKYIPENERPKVKADDPNAVFAEIPVSSPAKKDLLLNIDFPGERFFVEWAAGMRSSFEANVYHEENVKDAENAEANARLGTIIQKVKA